MKALLIAFASLIPLTVCAQQLDKDQIVLCDAEVRAAVPKVVGVGSNGAVHFFASSNPTQAEKNAAVTIMQKYITPPETAHVKIDTTQ